MKTEFRCAECGSCVCTCTIDCSGNDKSPVCCVWDTGHPVKWTRAVVTNPTGKGSTR